MPQHLKEFDSDIELGEEPISPKTHLPLKGYKETLPPIKKKIAPSTFVHLGKELKEFDVPKDISFPGEKSLLSFPQRFHGAESYSLPPGDREQEDDDYDIKAKEVQYAR